MSVGGFLHVVNHKAVLLKKKIVCTDKVMEEPWGGYFHSGVWSQICVDHEFGDFSAEVLHCVANFWLGFLHTCFPRVFFSCYGKSSKDKQDLCPLFGPFVFIATFAATQVVERSNLELKGNFKPVILNQMEIITHDQ